ncbi:septal ring lytic transglycosylase RlpA family protein [Candidatus Parabeggiatoa sp. HSG14]|uniref:septal ring lytic transglycosylase RlpA family protein n=1 Tax=Candidatus Parabeggiatoa sp. HSG14 TaxID=3055593 RepID=UPI0025A8BCF2|nr:septal ring lytic transglycosylase RlpA family protein [Thiotrichales bacterium HSG14]
MMHLKKKLTHLTIIVLFIIGCRHDRIIAVAHANGEDNVAVCTNKYTHKRVVTLDYIVAGKQVPCQVVYEKRTEKTDHRQVLWRAKTSVGYCERKTKRFIQKLTRYGWQCSYKEIKKISEETPSDKPITVVPPVAVNMEEGYRATCNNQPINLKNPLTQIAKKLTGLKYDSSQLQDCAGIFHQVVKQFKHDYCPNYDYPNVSHARDTRRIAKWYHKRGELILIHSPLQQSSMIKPGAVMFYGYPNKRYKNVKAKDLFVQNTGINHIGVVISVMRDVKNKVLSYQLFHGRRPGKPSSITDFHKRQSTHSYYPPFGNGREQWLAITPLVKQQDDSQPPAKFQPTVIVLKGEASYYADSLHGRRTASGKPYNKNKFTAAHKTLPFGTRVRITYLKTKKSVEVVINDRGPFYKKRIIDLSRKAAEQIGLIRAGHGKVKIEVMQSTTSVLPNKNNKNVDNEEKPN